jgi:hypothetical protein
MNDNLSIYGFFTCRIYNSILIIDILCSNKYYKGIGSKLMYALRLLGQNLKIDKIITYSVDTSIGFYKKQGFQLNTNIYTINSQQEKDMHSKSKDEFMSYQFGGKRKNTKKKNIKKKHKKTRKN